MQALVNDGWNYSWLVLVAVPLFTYDWWEPEGQGEVIAIRRDEHVKSERGPISG